VELLCGLRPGQAVHDQESMIVDSLLTIINYHARGQTIIGYHEEFEQAQNE